MGPALMQMLQPGLEAQLGNATASGIATPAVQTAAATSPAAPTTSAAPPATNASTSAGSSSRAMPNGTVGGKRNYDATLQEEFKMVMERGETDANKAAVEAMKRVSALVKEGMVEPPERQ